MDVTIIVCAARLKFTLLQARKAERESRGIAVLFL